MVSVEVYCDGSVSPAKMDNIISSSVDSKFLGRVAILIPELDFGLLEKIREGALTPKGNPASTQMEILALRRGSAICIEKEIKDYVLLTDSQGAPATSEIQQAKWLEPGRLHYASMFLERIMNRGRYLRHSRKVMCRMPANRLQEEIFRMFEADKVDFRLSENLLWNKITMEMEARDEGS